MGVPPPPALPKAPFLDRYLFESPWLLVALLTAAAVVVFLTMHTESSTPRRRSRARVLIGFFLLASVVAIASARFIITPAERMRETTRQMISATAAGDIKALSPLLIQDCTLVAFFAPSGLKKSGILDVVTRYLAPGGTYRLREFRIQSLSAYAYSETRGRAQVKVWGALEQGFPGQSWWAIDLVKDPAGEWRVSGIMPLSISGVSNASGSNATR